MHACLDEQVTAASALGQPADFDTISEELFRQLSSGQTVNLAGLLGGSGKAPEAEPGTSSQGGPASSRTGQGERASLPSAGSSRAAGEQQKGPRVAAGTLPPQRRAAPAAAVDLHVSPARPRPMPPSRETSPARGFWDCCFGAPASWKGSAVQAWEGSSLPACGHCPGQISRGDCSAVREFVRAGHQGGPGGAETSGLGEAGGAAGGGREGELAGGAAERGLGQVQV